MGWHSFNFFAGIGRGERHAEKQGVWARRGKSALVAPNRNGPDT
jgi:hypothetical protein